MEYIAVIGAVLYAFLFLASSAFTFYMVPVVALGGVLAYLKKRETRIGYRPLFYNYIFILIMGAIFNFFSPSGHEGVKEFLVTNTYFIYIYIFLNAIFEKKHMRYIIIAFMTGGAVLSVICIAQYYVAYIHGGSMEAIASFRSPGLVEYFYVGLYLIFTGIMLFSKIFNKDYSQKMESKNIIFLVLLLLGNILNFEAIILNKSRAAIYTYMFICILITLYRFSWKKTSIAIILLLGIYFLNPPEVRGMSEHITISMEDDNPRSQSDNMRLLVFKGAVEIYKRHPIFGVGNDHFQSALWMKKYFNTMERDGMALVDRVNEYEFEVMSEAHSIYFNLLIKNGILIIAFLIQFFIIIPMLFFKTMKKSENIEEEGDIIGAFGGILAFLITGITWYSWHYMPEIQEIFQFMTFIIMFYYVKYYEKN